MNTISWLWSFVPYWALWVVPAIVLLFTIPYWGPVWNLLPSKVKWALGGIAAIVVSIQYGRNKGAAAERQKRADENAAAQAKKKEIENEVSNLSDDDVDKRLSDNGWLRDR